MKVAARVALSISAIAGLALAWILYDWVGNGSEHCDFDDTCYTEWMPRAFFYIDLLWGAMLVFGSLGLLAAAWAGWHKGILIVVGLLCGATLVFIGLTMLHPLSDRHGFSMSVLTSDPYFYGHFPWYRTMGRVVAACSLALGVLAIRAPGGRPQTMKVQSSA